MKISQTQAKKLMVLWDNNKNGLCQSLKLNQSRNKSRRVCRGRTWCLSICLNCYLRWDLTNFLHIINGVFIEDLVALTTLKDNISRKLCLASGGKRILFLIRTLAKPLTFEKFVKTKELNKKFGSSLPTDPRYLAKQNLDNFHQKSCMAGECHKYILKPPLFIKK